MVAMCELHSTLHSWLNKCTAARSVHYVPSSFLYNVPSGLAGTGVWPQVAVTATQVRNSITRIAAMVSRSTVHGAD